MEFPKSWNIKDKLTPEQNALMDLRGGYLGEWEGIAFYSHKESKSKIITVEVKNGSTFILETNTVDNS